MTEQRLVLGTAQLGLPYGIANARGLLAAAEVDVLLACAVELGIRAFDTAPAYGVAEERIGAWLQGERLSSAVTITTKLPGLGTGIAPSSIARTVADAVEGSRRRLRIDMIDVYLLHDPSDLERYGPALLDALALERARGHIRSAGLSAYAPDEAALCLEIAGLGSVQHPLNLLDRRLTTDGLLLDLLGAGVAVQARSLFLQGLFALDPSRIPERARAAREPLASLHRLCADWGMRPIDAALPTVLALGPSSAVIGADTPEHLRAAVASAGRPIPNGLLRAIENELTDVPVAAIDPRRWIDAEPDA